jgi:hypothetical protein
LSIGPAARKPVGFLLYSGCVFFLGRPMGGSSVGWERLGERKSILSGSFG